MSNIQTTQDPSIERFFAESVDAYLNRSAGNSINRLSNESGINRKTLNKMRMMESEISSIDRMKLIKLVQVCLKCVTMKDAFKKLEAFLSEKDDAYKALNNAFSEKGLRVASNLESLIQSEEEFALFMLAANKGGTTLFQIGSVLGASGEEALESLESKGVLKRDGVRVDLDLESEKDFSVVPRELIKKYFGLFARMYKLSHSGKKRNYLAYSAQNINREALGKIYNVLESAHCEINKILADKESLGDLPFYMGLVMDTFTRDNNSENITGGGNNELH